MPSPRCRRRCCPAPRQCPCRGQALGLLLVFRTNKTYQRLAEACALIPARLPRCAPQRHQRPPPSPPSPPPRQALAHNRTQASRASLAPRSGAHAVGPRNLPDSRGAPPPAQSEDAPPRRDTPPEPEPAGGAASRPPAPCLSARPAAASLASSASCLPRPPPPSHSLPRGAAAGGTGSSHGAPVRPQGGEQGGGDGGGGRGGGGLLPLPRSLQLGAQREAHRRSPLASPPPVSASAPLQTRRGGCV